MDEAGSLDADASAIWFVVRVHLSKDLTISFAKVIVARLQRKPILIISQDFVESPDEASLFLSID